MATIRHIFVYVVRRPDDPFLGLKHLLSQQRLACQIISEVRLPAECYEIVQKVEYTPRRFFRFFHYKTVFQQLENLLREALEQGGQDNWHVVYLSDEGVWAEFLRTFRERHPDLKLLSVNVQHGFERRVRIAHRNLRRAANWLSKNRLGFPAFGMGCFGGVGSGVFEVYLTYDKAASDFIRENTGDLAYECPAVIKHALLERFKAAKKLLSDKYRNGPEVMFALQPTIDNIKGSPLDVFRELTSVAKLLVEKHGRRMAFRAHPGMQNDRVMDDYRRSGIDRYADMDAVSELADQLAGCCVVMSYDSTVLWEAYILGLVPVSVHGNCYRGDLSFPHEVLDVSAGLEAQLEQILRKETAEKYRHGVAEDAFDWEAIIMGLAREVSPANTQAAMAHPVTVG
jgi:hypothetical protein